ncbi:CRE-VIT-6 protein, partial [Aphelenchoides avenae]
MRTLVFVVVGLCALTALARRPENSDRRLSDVVEAKPFRSGQEYSFRYDAQVATGLSPKASDQKAATRLEAKVKLAFRSNDKAIVRMEDIRFGQRNDEMYQPHEMQPMRMFEQKPVSDEQERQLHLPVQITIEEGVVKRINFHEEDAPWSKNVKRGVINLVQINLKRQSAEESNERDESEPASCSNDQTSCAFTLKEITLEGKCKTTYTMNKARQTQSSSDDKPRFNVTKAIDFQQCSEIADVAYGFDSQEIQPECTFQTDAEEDQKTEKKRPQGVRCDPKEVKQEKIDRTTVYRYTLQGKPQSEYGIERATVLSQYTIKNLNAEQHKAVHHVTVLAELVYEDDSQASSKATSDSGISGKTETLLYNAEREVQEKRFFMNGDEEFGRQSPFEQVPNKAGLAKKI